MVGALHIPLQESPLWKTRLKKGPQMRSLQQLIATFELLPV
jgi:hypothetical protein